MNKLKTLKDLYADRNKYSKRTDVIAVSGNLSNMFIDNKPRTDEEKEHYYD